MFVLSFLLRGSIRDHRGNLLTFNYFLKLLCRSVFDLLAFDGGKYISVFFIHFLLKTCPNDSVQYKISTWAWQIPMNLGPVPSYSLCFLSLVAGVQWGFKAYEKLLHRTWGLQLRGRKSLEILGPEPINALYGSHLSGTVRRATTRVQIDQALPQEPWVSRELELVWSIIMPAWLPTP